MLGCKCCHIRSYQALINPKPACKIPLVSVKMNVIIQNGLASISIFQEFVNEEPNPIECEYSFPIIDEGVVTKLKLHLQDGSTLTSTIEEEVKTSEIYQDAISEGNTAAMSKIDELENLTIFIGNLAFHEKIISEFNFSCPLSSDQSY